MRSPMLAVAVALTFLLGGVGPTVAQDATPTAGGAATGTTIEPLAQAVFDDLPPAPAYVGLARFTFPPGAATPGGADPGSILVYIEAGALVATIEGPATVTRGTESEAPVATPGGEMAAEFQAGDVVAIPSGTSSQFHNEGQSEATLLAVYVWPGDPFGPVAETTLDGVGVEILVGGVLATVPPSPAFVLLARQTIAPGGGLAPEASPGPILAYVESGRVTYVLESGASAIVRGRRDGTPVAGERAILQVAPGSEAMLGPGDALLEEAGTVSGARNTGDAPHVHLIVLLGSDEAVAGTAAPEVATPAA